MSYRQLLDEAIGDSPASTIDLDRVIGRQRRNRRLRRWGACGAAAAAMLGVTATAALLSPAAEPSPAPAVRPGITTVAGTPEDLARLDEALVTAVKREAPGVVWINPASPGTPRWRSEGGKPPKTLLAYFRQGGISLDGIEGHLMVQIDRQRPDLFSGPRCVDLPEQNLTCRESVGPNGERIKTRVSSRVDEDRDGRSRVSRTQYVAVLRPDDTFLTVTLLSTLPEGGLPLTVEQQTAIALDPAVALGPLPPGVVVTPPPAASPEPETATPTRTPTRASGSFDPAQQRRIDSAVFLALRRQAPAVRAGNGADLESVWTDSGGDNTADSYWGQGRIQVGTEAGLFSVQISRNDPGFSGGLTCGKQTRVYTCKTGVGPHGERYRTVTNTSQAGSGVSAERTVDVLRKDGSWLAVTLAGDLPDGKFPLTAAQQQAVAFDTAIALAPTR